MRLAHAAGWGPRTARRSTRRGQALVEFALLGGLLVVLALGVVDFGRVLGTNAGIQNAAREAARQVTSYEQLHGTEPSSPTLADFIRIAAQNELGSGCNNCLTSKAAGCPNTAPPYSAGSALPQSMYPTAIDTGFIYDCSWHSSSDGKQHIEVIIAWRASLFTPLMQNIVGQPLLHGIADGTEP